MSDEAGRGRRPPRDPAIGRRVAPPAAREDLTRPEALEGDLGLERTLRPRTLDDFVGQVKVKENLSVFIKAASLRGEPLEHVLLHGPPGLGKTTLAHIIATEQRAALRITSGPALDKAGDLAAILTNLEPGDVLFIDEVHRLNAALEEILYPAMEDFRLDVIIGQGPSARSVRLELPRFTLVGATTRIGLLSSPLRDRFGIAHHLDFYPAEHLRAIVERSARLLEVGLDEAAALEIAGRSRGTPRIANRLLRRVRDFVQVSGSSRVSLPSAASALERLNVDRYGLDETDRRVLGLILDKFQGGPVGLGTIAAAIGEEEDTIEDVVEPYLLQIGFLERTPRGRRATGLAARHLGVPSEGKEPDQRTLWRE